MKQKNTKKASKRKSDEQLLAEEFDFSKAVRREPLKKGATTSIRWDEDVRLWIATQAENDGVPFGTKVNSLLRQMKERTPSESRLDKLEAEIADLKKAILKKTS